MNKMHPLTNKFILLCFLSIFISGIIYILLLPISLCLNVQQTNEFSMRTGMNFLVLSPIATWVLYMFYRPIQTALRIIDSGQTVSKTQYTKALKAINNMPLFLFILGAVAYIGGLLISLIGDFSSHHIQPTDYYIGRAMIAISWGVMNGLLLSRLLGYYLIQAQLKLRIVELDEKNAKRSPVRDAFFPNRTTDIVSVFMLFCIYRAFYL